MFPHMKWIKQGLSGIAVLALGAASAVNGFADAKLNPYETIVDRNPFGLKPPPPPPDPTVNAPPPAPLATVELTGITGFLSGKKRALLEITPGPGKPVQRPILAEGERVESVEVVSINVEKNEVVVKNGSLTTNLSFKVTKTAVASVPPPGPGFQPNPALPFNPANLGVPGAAATPTVFTPGNPGGSSYSSGRGNAVAYGASTAGAPTGGGAVAAFGGQPTAGAFGAPAASGAPYGAGAFTGPNAATPGASSDPFKNIPPRVPRVAQPPVPPQGGHIDPAVQYINLKVQQQQAAQRGVPFPPMPPVPGLQE
jgi:hypothetical protein